MASSGMYQVPKEKALVLVKNPPVAPEWRSVFLSSCAESHGGQETVSDLFNAERRFLPLLNERGEIVIVRRNSIRWIRVEDPRKMEWHYYDIREGAPQSTVRMGFEDGEVLEGVLYAIGRAGEQRVLDVVNRDEDFVHLEMSTGLFLVNLKHVTTIFVKEEDHGGAR